MRKLFAIASAVMLDAIRRKVVWVVLVFAAIMAIVSPSLPSYGVGVSDAVYREVSIALMFVAALVVSLSLSATRVPAEIERRTVFNVLARDVRRWQYVTGTWLGMCAVVGVAILMFVLIVIAVGAAVYGAFMPRLFEAGLAIWLEMCVLIAFAVMVSTRVGVATTIVATLALTFAGHSVVNLLTGGDPHAVAPKWVPSLDAFNVINPVAHGDGYSLIYAVFMIAVFAGWSGLFLLAGSALFGNRDL